MTIQTKPTGPNKAPHANGTPTSQPAKRDPAAGTPFEAPVLHHEKSLMGGTGATHFSGS